MVTYTSKNVEETHILGKQMAQKCKGGDILILCGDLGAGKTQFSKGFAQGLGISDEITSPTFNIMFEYVGSELALLHFDLYRLESIDALEDIDYFGCLESGAVCLVVWGDKFIDAMPDEYIKLNIHLAENVNISSSETNEEQANDGTDEPVRCIEIEGFGTRGKELEQDFAELLLN